jgi:histidine triad (HIT) family protein
MEINSKQIVELKKQVINQINSTFPEDKKDYAIEQVESMNEEQFVEFLKKNKLINLPEEEQSSQNSKENYSKETPFRLIVEGKIPSYPIDENKDSLAVLEINPISKAHIIIIPKKPIKETEKLPSSLFTLAKKISKRINSNFKPKEVLISSSNVLGETIVQVLPVYTEEALTSKRHPASKDELEELKKILGKKFKSKIPKAPKPKKIKEQKINPIKETKLWLPRRIP